MKKILTIVTLLSIIAFSPVAAQDLDEVLDNVYKTTGMDKLRTVNTMKMTGKAFQMGMETPFTTYVTREGKLYLEVPIQGQLMKQGFNGETGWMVAPWTGSSDAIDLPEEQIKGLKIQADIDGMLYDFDKKGYKTELIGKEDYEGAEAYLIRQETEDGDVFTHYIDAENYVVIKTQMTMQYQGNEVVIDTYMSDYKPVEGILMAYSTEVMVEDQVQRKITIEEVLLNVEIDDSIFEKPATPASETPDEE